jgi:hypothetical protein
MKAIVSMMIVALMLLLGTATAQRGGETVVRPPTGLADTIREATTPRAPPPAVGPADISGSWDSNIALVYQITQQGERFDWIVVGHGDHKGMGRIDHGTPRVRWIDPDASRAGDIEGQMMLDADGKVGKIQWSNGVVFKRPSVLEGEPKPVIPINLPEPRQTERK